jgi:hypothetical protein
LNEKIWQLELKLQMKLKVMVQIKTPKSNSYFVWRILNE